MLRMTTSNRSLRALTIVAILFPFPVTSSAHLVTTGLGPVYDGMGHFMLSMGTLLPMLALLMAASVNAQMARRTAFFVPVLWSLGAAIALNRLTSILPNLAVLPSLVLLGAGCTLALNKSPKIMWGLVFGLTPALGALEGVALSDQIAAPRLILGGAIALSIFSMLIPAASIYLREGVRRLLLLRVIGSWLAATGLLLFGWWLRTQ